MKLAPWGAAGAAILAAAAPAHAGEGAGLLQQALGDPDGWTIRGSARARIEGIEGQYRPKVDGHDRFLSFRTKLFVEHREGPVRVAVEMMDSRGYLERSNSSVSASDVNTLEPIQALIGIDLGSTLGEGSKSALSLGRFAQNIGSERLIGTNEAFPNTENSITGAAFDWSNAAHDKLRLFWGMPTTRLPGDSIGVHHNRVEWDRQRLNVQFFGGSFTKAGVLGGTMEVYGYGLIERDSPNVATRDRRLFTPGLRFFRAPRKGGWDYDFEGIYQGGKIRATAAAGDMRDLDVSAWFAHAGIGHSFALDWAPRLSLSLDHASGDRGKPGSFGRFDGLYGSRRAELGPTGFYGALARSNVTMPEVRFEAVPSKRIDTFVAYRPVWLDTVKDGFSGLDLRDPTGASDRFAGHQLEGRVRYWLVPKLLRLDTGLVWLAKGRVLRNAPNVRDRDDTRYGYMDVTFAF